MINYDKNINKNKHHIEKRYSAFLEGHESDITVLDSLAVGLYWGEGSKSVQDWSISNSDKEIIRVMVEWAKSVGQGADKFKAKITVHEEDNLTDDYIKDYWSEAGIPRENIRIYKNRSSSSKRKIKSKMLCGVCNLSSVKNGVRLFELLKGKKYKLLGNTDTDKWRSFPYNYF